jgi:large subunit ribosomal protein L5
MITKNKEKETFATLSKEFAYTNVHQTPKLLKVVVSSGVGSAKDKNRIKLVEDRLAKITGQKPSARLAKQSIAQFKVREGETVGFQVTMHSSTS